MPGEITRRLVKSNGEGKKIFITGGASGLGAESALACARAGASAIILTDLPAQKSKAEALAEQILAEAPGTKVLFYEHDVTKEPEWEKVFEQVHEAVGPIDVLLNSAGIGIGHQVLEDLPLEDWQRCIDINLTGTFLGVKHGIRSMKQVTTPEWKSIINISSIEGIIGEPQLAAYNASKGGVRLLSKSTALYGVRYQIRCTSIHPGYIETPMVMRPAEHRGSDGEAWLDDVKSRHPMGRLGKPREIADAVVFLASEESSFMTGTEVVVDGGYTAR